MWDIIINLATHHWGLRTSPDLVDWVCAARQASSRYLPESRDVFSQSTPSCDDNSHPQSKPGGRGTNDGNRKWLQFIYLTMKS